MKALSLLQPWATFLILGIKEFETRSWDTKHRGPVAIHASARMDKSQKLFLKEMHQKFPRVITEDVVRQSLQTGVVLGTSIITNTFSTNDLYSENIPRAIPIVTQREALLGDFSKDRYFWEMCFPVGYVTPVPAKGKLGLWEWNSYLPTTSK